MDNNKKKISLVKLISDAAILGIFAAMIFLPIALLTVTGNTSSPLSYESGATLPEVSFENYLNGTLTAGVQDWFSKSWPLRSTLVLAYNQMIYDIDTFSFGEPSQKIEILDASEVNTETTTVDELIEEPVEEAPGYSDFNPLYADINRLQYEAEMIEPTGYKGTAQVVIGKSGYLYENGYINEYLGYSKMYREVTRETINDQVEKLEFIQEKLAERGTAFILVFSPSKAAEYPDAIPDWYKNANVEPEDYIRPFDMMIERLESSTVNYIDSGALYDEVGLDVTFPKTGIHWNKLAVFETMKAMIASYEEQTGEEIRRITADTINQSERTPGFGSPEQDIFGLVYSTMRNAEKIVDDYYYWPEIYVENEECTNKIRLLIQGGSFTHDFNTYFPMYKISERITSIYYNQKDDLFKSDEAADTYWNRSLNKCDYVIFECNEQFVRGFGGNAPQWAQADVNGYGIGNRVYESLYNYLLRNE